MALSTPCLSEQTDESRFSSVLQYQALGRIYNGAMWCCTNDRCRCCYCELYAHSIIRKVVNDS